MIFFTSDTHYFHFSVLKYANRPFNSLEEMHSKMIENWNAIVGKNDTVYHLGDFFLTTKLDLIDGILDQLNGHIKILPGNHDQWLRKHARLRNASKIMLLSPLEEIKHYHNDKKYYLTLCHFPMLRWNKSHYGAIQLHGHSHGNLDEYNATQPLIRMDVGVDSSQYTPINFEQILRYNREKIEKFESGGMNHHLNEDL